MPITRRGFVQRAGLAAAASLVGRASGAQATDAPETGLAKTAGVPCDESHTFRNWSRTIEFSPERFCRPRTEEDVVSIVNDAIARQKHVRTQGAGHSFAQLHATNDTLVTLKDIRGGVWVGANNHVTVPGGIKLRDLIDELRKKKLGLRNLGSITEQSVAGAFSTGTHGSGRAIGAISTQVVGVRLVDGKGTVRTITDAPSDAEQLAAARVNVGALGIITQVTLDCVPDYKLEYTAYVTTLAEIVKNIDQLAQENDRVVVWWFLMSKEKKKRDTCVLITKNALNHPVSAVLQNAIDATGPLSQILPKDPTVMLALLGDAPKTGFKKIRHDIDDYDQVLTVPLLPYYHRECEYAIPEEKTVAALKMMREVVEEGDITLSLPVELRYVASDEILLSPCYKRTVAYIGASTLVNSTEVFERFEPLMKTLGGVPHWGKCYTLTQPEVEAMYPATYKRFLKVRDDFDPQRVFANTLLNDLLP